MTSMLTRIGARPFVGPELPLNLHGLPEGDYDLFLSDSRTPLTVQAGEVTAVELP